MAKIRVLITGVAGFIGSNILRTLLASSDKNYEVIGIDNLATGRLENITESLDQFEFINADIRDRETILALMRNIDYVLHQAAIPSVQRSLSEPDSSHSANIHGTFNLLEAARQSGIKKFVYAASSSAYGDTPVLPKIESMPTLPLSPYAVQKLTGEMYCRAYWKCFGLPTIALRYFNVFGPHQDPNSHYAAVIPKFIKSILKGEPPSIYGDGEQTRDFTFVENVIQANLKAMFTEGGNGDVLNIACGTNYSVNYLCRKLNEFLGRDVTPRHTEPVRGDIRDSLADIQKAKAIIGYIPETSFEDGLKHTVSYFSDYFLSKGEVI